MSTLLFLRSTDFHLEKGNKGNLLCHGIRGLSLVLFYSTECVYCQQLIPVFKRLPERVQGCIFAMVNVSHNKETVGMARETIAPIKYVPYLVLYIDGRPFMRYDGPKRDGEIRQFILEVSNKIRKKQQFSSERVKDDGKAIPAYTIGKPLFGDDDKVCYLPFSDAYHKDS